MSKNSDGAQTPQGAPYPREKRRGGLHIGNVLLVVAGLAVLGVVGFGYSLMQDQSVVESTSPEADTILFPDIPSDLAEGTSLTLSQNGNQIRIEKTATGWGLADWGNYPVRSDKLETLLRELTALRGTVIDSTKAAGAMPAGTPDPLAKAVAFTLDDAAGQPLAGGHIGEVIATPGGAQITRTYVRRTSDDAVFLTDRAITLENTPLAWVDPVILDIPRDRIQSVAITDTDNKKLAMKRQEDGARFAPTEVPGGGEISEVWMMTRIAGSLEQLQFSAVRPADAASEQTDGALATAEFVTNSGLRVTLHMVRIEDGAWTRIATDTVDGANSSARQEEQQLTARTEGWQFLLPDFMIGTMANRTEDIVEQPGGSTPAPPLTPAPETQNPATPQ
ncbi:MAG: DUF4340 domain-containing protein [Alphaproteobacteria bacterium]|nr:DUF4340 domain-containing protein [Alphaproteobacteria bacterium]MBU0796346.1 DUF4340 domain-containing protein [Alphaproteobacteria bacterium]MBU0887765.1 DUF4340 domain-containing protein [Alphaproteobacteria bacterium]MBU1815012.1 DUF4340 domain-containing protein [Alphaproteobacteria bacterium]